MARAASAIVFAAFLAAEPTHAFEAAGADIIGLRLGMSESEVVAELAHQGYAAHPTPQAITANTKDGRLQVVLSAEQGVTEISYVLYDRGAGAPAKIRESILEPVRRSGPGDAADMVPGGRARRDLSR